MSQAIPANEVQPGAPAGIGREAAAIMGRARQRAGMTVEQFAEALGVLMGVTPNSSSVQSWEAPNACVPFSAVVAACQLAVGRLA